ncbi:helix-turn-helix domain-containing protein [Actinoplanes couchii]|nr:helix-turn-helix domain-containing protein [Actinoplanes couchii]MDR6318484.1 transcriptional regulator with XRE-family HTH domain [Actinoplanes couchii]
MTGPDVRGDIRQFLMTRRARITPQLAGLPDYGGRRRVPGLRREELALLAGISVEYLTQLERGHARGVSDEVVNSLSRALQLDDVERTHLIDLIRAVNTPPYRGLRHAATDPGLRRSVRQVLDSMTGAAAFVRNQRLDILAANRLGGALYAPVLDNPELRRNLARFVFLDPRATSFYRDWTGIAHDAVGSLRTAAGREPGDPAMTELVGDLSIRSERFRIGWADHEVKYYRSGVQQFHHATVGDLDLDYDALELPADPGLTIVTYTARPGSPAHEALHLLGA